MHIGSDCKTFVTQKFDPKGSFNDFHNLHTSIDCLAALTRKSPTISQVSQNLSVSCPSHGSVSSFHANYLSHCDEIGIDVRQIQVITIYQCTCDNFLPKKCQFNLEKCQINLLDIALSSCSQGLEAYLLV